MLGQDLIFELNLKQIPAFRFQNVKFYFHLNGVILQGVFSIRNEDLDPILEILPNPYPNFPAQSGSRGSYPKIWLGKQ